jgi:hypothetical protein
MNRLLIRSLFMAVVAGLSACGEAPQEETPPAQFPMPMQSAQQVSFTGYSDPVTGRLQIFMGPQAGGAAGPLAAIGQVPEDADGNVTTATAGTAQVYGAAVGFASRGGTGYPAGCTGATTMYSSVAILSGFTEQLRNVYARMTAVSNGQTFCNNATPGAIAPPTPNVGLYFYQPLNAGASPSAISRSVQWAMNLVDNSAFWFRGELWAEIIPQLPAIVRPTDGASVSLGNGLTGTVRFNWTNDARADGGTSGETTYAVARPTVRGALLTVRQCGPATGVYDPASCTGTTWASPQRTARFSQVLPKGYWFQWTLKTVFSLPGQGTATTTGTLTSTSSFKTVT